ncbi:unnamed protein product [Kuraishia capsulata CBS 1993]|uniref:Zn(2)-C6 fungal-type domain-containing protein n=1 Tax=Kuraishia capsulata CBS 1993 TaxID=1382522 RepID=W6MTG7_9ASCO|nr:uncharacterized protein KUCA_T00005736001 [Kuraishia capsulata CBS 1993]CDK29743.1 unnamed protein product [Kuraishia capsulata CBS 1993]
MSEPIGIIGRTHYACLRCKSQKVKCSGTKPTCQNCLSSSKECVYPLKDRKVIVMESQWLKLNQRVKELESDAAFKVHGNTRPDQDFGSGKLFEGDTDYSLNEDQASSGSDQEMDTMGVFNRLSIHDPEDLKRGHHYVDDEFFRITYTGWLNLPSKDYVNRLIGLTFQFLNESHYLYDEAEFTTRVNHLYGNLDYQSLEFLSQFWITLALGEVILYSLESNASNSRPRLTPGLKFYKLALQFFQSPNEDPNLTSIQVALQLGYYSQTLNRITTAYTFFGLAMRWCLSLGLHLDVPKHPEDAVFREKCKRVWWTTYVLDAFANTRFRLPTHVEFDQCKCEQMLESYLDLKDGFKVNMLANQVALLKFSNLIITQIYELEGVQRLVANTDRVLRVLETHFEKNLISDFTKMNLEISKGGRSSRSLIHLFMKFNHYVIMTARPLIIAIFKGLIKEDETTKRITKKCILSACHNVDLLYSLKDLNQLVIFDYWDSHFCFSAILVLEMAISTGKTYQQIDKGVMLLKFMAMKGNHVAMENFIKLCELTQMLDEIGIPIKTTVPLNLDIQRCLFEDVPKRGVDIKIRETNLNNVDSTLAINLSPIGEQDPEVPANIKQENGQSQTFQRDPNLQQMTSSLSYLSNQMDTDLSNEKYHFTPMIKQDDDLQVFNYGTEDQFNGIGIGVDIDHLRSFDNLFGNFASWDYHPSHMHEKK